MVSTRTDSVLRDTSAYNSSMHGRKEDWTAPRSCSLDGMIAILRPLVDFEEHDRRCEACCLERFGMTSSSSRFGFSTLQKHVLMS